MSWMNRLYQTYELVEGKDFQSKEPLVPVSHTIQNAHINIIIDIDGKFVRANILSKKKKIVLPATESSAGRTRGEAPHPLADNLSYVANDYKKYGGQKASYFAGYSKQLQTWSESNFSHPHVKAVFKYISKGEVIKDLVAKQILFVDENNKLLTKRSVDSNNKSEEQDIFAVLPKKKGQTEQGSALVCWSVQTPEDPESKTWENNDIRKAWKNYQASLDSTQGFCFIKGEKQVIAINHPAKIRNTSDKAKLISSNDDKGFTYLGRFKNALQAASVSFDVTQKAHSALCWLIERQGVKTEKQVILVWAISGKPVPNPMKDVYDYESEDDLDETETNNNPAISNENNSNNKLDLSTDIGQRVAEKFKRKLRGWQKELNDYEQLSILALDSATPGRMSITYYQEQLVKDYFKHLDDWYENFAWFQRRIFELKQAENKKNKTLLIWTPLAPSPYAIVQAAYGKNVTDNLKKQTLMRILACITEGRAFPVDIVNQCVTRASNPLNIEVWEWERNIGVACALYRGFCSRHPDIQQRRKYTMALDVNNTSRDYLYGRLLAVAERIEQIALNIAGEKRRTNAERYMPQFADRPLKTWLIIVKAIDPYKARLRSSLAPFLHLREKEITTITNLFEKDDFIKPDKLTGEFLLGYHCQKMQYRKSEVKESNESKDNEITTANPNEE